MDKYLITGASGNIGRHLVNELLEVNKSVKAAVHNNEKAKSLFKDKENLEIVHFDFFRSY